MPAQPISENKPAVNEWNTGEEGLSDAEAARRLKEYGENKLPEKKPESVAIIFLRQFQSPLIYILLAASVVVFAIGEIIDGSIILAVLFFNAIVGTIQEGKAQNTLRSLKQFVETKATVLREGRELIIPDTEVVTGDLIILEEGEKVPADARVIYSRNLKVEEAALTGESEPIHKIVDDSGRAREDKHNLLFKGTHVVAGGGRAIVIATGIGTVIGHIAKEISTVESEIPLKANIRHLSRLIITIVAVIVVILFALGLSLGKELTEIFTTAVALSVSIIPEGLPIVMTLVLATGVWRMSKRNALVKKLQAVEALGQARIIAVDKTGTLTRNEMVIEKVYAGETYSVTGVGYEPKGDVMLGNEQVDIDKTPALLHIGKLTAFCSNAHVMYSEEAREWRIGGDPTEAAMVVLAHKLGFDKAELEKTSPMVAEIAFDYSLKYRATAHKENNHLLVSVIGAPEVMLEHSKKIWEKGKEHPLTAKKREELERVFTQLSSEGLRVVAVAKKEISAETIAPEDIEDLTFVGFFGMKDALRLEVAEAMRKAVSAGIKVVMITGDHKLTAEAIAREAGIFRTGDRILTGKDIDMLNDAELTQKLALTTVFARVTPEHKLRIIKAYKARGDIVAMTGDGVNDAPSLVAADLGVAMGKVGTEVAKEAADIVLLDDNFGSIVTAVEEGRGIYKTIKKVILYLFAGSWGQVFTILGSLVLALPLPLLPAQIIWLNFVTDGFLDVALAMEPKEEGLLRGNFERPKKYLVDKLMLKRLVFMTIPMMLGALFVFSLYVEDDLTKAWTMTLTVLAAFHWFNAWNCRHESKSIFILNPFSNRFLVGATIVIVFLHLAALYTPLLQTLLRTTPLSLGDWLLILPIAFSIVIVEEVRKFFYRRKERMA